MTDRIDIIQKIVNLRQVDGRSEAEAMACLTRAERLMESYRIEEAELAMAEATGEVTFDIVDIGSQRPCASGRNRHKAQLTLSGIEKFCEVQIVIKHDQTIRMVGDRPDVEMGQYLLEMIMDSLDRSYEDWKKTQQAVGRGAKPAFQMSMALRIQQRLWSMAQEREAKARELLPQTEGKDIRELTGTALVVVAINEQKREAVQDEFKARYPRLGTASGFSFRNQGSSASAAGRAAGDRVNLGRPIGGSSHAAIAAE